MKKEDPLDKKKLWILLGAIFFASFSLIALEITLSRLLSVLLSYHYVFAILSLALLGLGGGGIFLHLFGSRITKEKEEFRGLVISTSLFSMAISFSVLFIVTVGGSDLLGRFLPLYCLLLFLPFFFAGIFFAEVYRLFPSISGRTYGIDLIGAAAGSLCAIVFLNLLGGLRVHFLLGIVASLSALLLAMMGTTKKAKVIIVAGLSFGISSALLVTTLAGFYHAEVPIGANPAKEIHDALSESSFRGKILETRWSAFGRTDLVGFGHNPDHMDIYIDGTAGSPMYRFNGNPSNPNPSVKDLKTTFPGYFPFLHLREDEKNNALIIGPGGGRDILLALMGNVQEITAVEVNRDLVEIVRNYSTYNGGIYTDLANVKIVIDEGRHFLRRQQEKYDIIMLSLPVTNTSRSLEGFSLTENFLFTTESILNYLDHMTDEGCLIVVGHNDAEILRLLSVSLSALNTRGIEHTTATKHIYITGSKGLDNYLVFVLKKRPFEPHEALLGYEVMHQLGLDPSSSYFPYLAQKRDLNPALVSLSYGGIGLDRLQKMVEDRGYDISPVTDNNPFFYKIHRGIPKPVSTILGSSVILILLVISIPFLSKRGALEKRNPSKEPKLFNRNILNPLILFSMLGVGFMLIEISLIQKFSLFLGHPVLSLAVLLFSLLGWAGIGSLCSGRFPSDKLKRRIAMTSLSVAVMVMVYIFFLPLIFDQLLMFDLKVRLLATLLALGPIAFLMGFPFPLGLRVLKDAKMEHSIPWMWGINGVGSVLGSAVTVFLAISLGFTEALLLSAICYFTVFMAFVKS